MLIPSYRCDSCIIEQNAKSGHRGYCSNSPGIMSTHAKTYEMYAVVPNSNPSFRQLWISFAWRPCFDCGRTTSAENHVYKAMDVTLLLLVTNHDTVKKSRVVWIDQIAKRPGSRRIFPLAGSLWPCITHDGRCFGSNSFFLKCFLLLQAREAPSLIVCPIMT